MKKVLVLLAALALTPVAAFAGPTFCPALPGANADGLKLSDVTFNSNNADGCYGIVEGNNTAALLNDLMGDAWDEGWTEALSMKWQAAGNGLPEQSGLLNDYLGFNWTLDADAAQQETWTLRLSGAGQLPILVDFVVVLKASTYWAAYFFDEERIPTPVNEGEFLTFKVTTVGNNGKTSTKWPALSHMSLYLRDGVSEVPEPASLLLFGTGLAFVGARLRRRR